MDSSVYINNSDIIETYFVRLDENEIKNIQKSIDNYYGKGELIVEKNVADVHALERYAGRKIEVVSKRYIDTVYGISADVAGSVNRTYEVSYYNYEFYAFYQSELSKLCDCLIENVFLENHDRLKLSMTIKMLLDYVPSCKVEDDFRQRIINNIKLEKVSPEELIKSDLTPEQKETVFDRIINVIRNKKEQKPIIVVAPVEFERDLDKKIARMREESHSLSENDEDEIKKIKKNILESLPTKSQLSTKR